MAKEKKKDPQRFVSPVGRVSYPNVFKPKAFEEGDDPAYDISLLCPRKKKQSFEDAVKTDPEWKPARMAILAAKTAKWGADKTKWPKKIHTSVFKDGDERSDSEGYKGTVVLQARNKNKPQVLNQKLEPVTEGDDQFYPGCYARVALRAYAYEFKNSKGVVIKRGVTLSLEGVQKHSDGQRFDGRIDATEVFEEIEDDSEDESSYESDGEESEEEGDDW